MNIRIRTTIHLSCADERIANALIKALEPDNISVPSNIRISNSLEEDKLKISIEFDGNPRGILTLRNTIDDLLEHLNIALKVVESVKDN